MRVGQHDEDDWELFEQAVLHRERKSDSDNDSEESGSKELQPFNLHIYI